MKKNALFLAFAFCIALVSYGQNAPADNKLVEYVKQITTFNKSYPQEKVYLHFDNTAYYQGENIWFKAYVISADRNSLSPLSKVLYVELLSPEGTVVETKKLKIENGQCHGDFRLPYLLFAGFYEVRAYTRYMLNFGQNNCFSRVFPVYEKPVTDGDYKKVIHERPASQRVPQVRPTGEQKEQINISFYPEGGSLITGLSSRVAFKAIGKNGESLPITGSIVDEKGNKMSDFETIYQGMGSFSLSTGKGKCFAKAHYQGKDYTVELPKALPSGYTLTIDNSDNDNMNLVVERNASLAGETLGLSVACRGVVYASDQLNMTTDSILQLNIPKKILPSGVIQLSLFNAKGEVLCERLAFVNHFSQMNITANQDKTSYQAYEKVNMNFQLSDTKGNPVETSFSVAVRDAETSSLNPYNDNALTNLLLSSELKGYIENPGYYFDSKDENKAIALDLLMLTQGWTRYVWKEMSGVQAFKVKQPVEKQLVIEGSVSSLIAKKKMENIEVKILLLADTTSQQGTCTTDKDGNFNFGLQDYIGKAKLTLQTKKEDKKKETNIRLERNFGPDIRAYFYPELHTQEYLTIDRNEISAEEATTNADQSKKVTAMDKKDHQLKELTVKGKKKEYGPLKLNIEYKADRELDKIKDLGDWQPAGIYELLGKLNKYFIYGDVEPKYKGKKVLFLRDNSLRFSGEVGTALAEDFGSSMGSTNVAGVGVQSNEAHNDDILNPKNPLPQLDEIESLAIVEEPADIIKICPQLLISNKYPYDRVVIVLMHCKAGFHHEPYGVRETTLDGYAYTKEFYSPNYEKTSTPDNNDYRRTLYWNPDVKTDKTGKATVSFFNTGSCKAMNISAETVTDRGMIGTLNK